MKKAAFTRIFDEHHLPLFRFAYRLTGSMADAEDIVQECFLGLLRADCGFDERRTSLRTYLPCVGSRLTYGFLDEAAAPGQIAAPDLVARLVTDCPAYAARRRLPAPEAA